MPVRKSAVELAACRGEAEVRPSLFSGVYQPPSQPILKVLADLKRDDPKFAFPAARLVGLYRRLWESCVSAKVCLVSSSCCEGEAYDGQPKHLKPNGFTYQRSFPAARLVGLYRRLWESCVSKHIDGQKLEQSNQNSCFFFVLRRGGLRWSAKAFEAEWFHLPKEGHHQKDPDP
jgi:hypothetical protein